MIMAIGYWIAFIIFAVCGGLLAAVSYYEQKNIPSLILSMILTIVICGGVWWYGANTESGRRSLKDQQSNFGHGIDRIWSALGATDGFALLNLEEAILLRERGCEPLFAERKPMDDGLVTRISRQHKGAALVRAVEAWHGIAA